MIGGALVALALSPAAAADGAITRTVTVGAVRREAIVVDTAPARAPLVLVLHGRLGTGEQVRRHSGFDDEAKRRGFVVAYPQGIDRRWNDLRQLTLAPEKRRLGTDDVGFILALVDALVGEGQVDPARVYVAGHSNGGFLALSLACTHADRFAGVAAVAATLPRTDCAPSRPVKALLFHGTEDGLVPFHGGSVGKDGARGFIRSNAETAQLFADKGGCGPATPRAPLDADATDGTRVVVVERVGCNVPVVDVIIEGGGHGWPGRKPPLPQNSREIDATAWIAAFFFDGRVP